MQQHQQNQQMPPQGYPQQNQPPQGNYPQNPQNQPQQGGQPPQGGYPQSPQNGQPAPQNQPQRGNPPPQNNGQPPQGADVYPFPPSGHPANVNPNSPAQNGANGSNREFESLHVYGGKAALCFDVDQTKQGFPTISIDGANATAPRTYDWKNKIRIQLTKQELPTVAAVLLGITPTCAFKSHGPQKDKGFEMQRQPGGKVYVKVFGGNGQGMRGVPIMPQDLFFVTSLVMRQLQASQKGASIADIISLLWATQNIQK